MPNWITNKIRTKPEVIKAMVNAEGHVDFALLSPFPGEFPWNFVSSAAEQLAQIVAGVPVSDHPAIAALERSNRSRASLADLGRDEDFEQFVQMLRNHRKCGFLHSMDFARATWGTKWNACESKVDEPAGLASFDTAWSCPMGALAALSKRFPESRIHVTYADEDIGSNCGTYTLHAGRVVQSDIAPYWSEMTDQEKQHWTRFAREVKGWTADDAEE